MQYYFVKIWHISHHICHLLQTWPTVTTSMGKTHEQMPLLLCEQEDTDLKKAYLKISALQQ